MSDKPNAIEFYRDFFDLETAKAFGQLLSDKGVYFSMEYPQTIIDSNFVGKPILPVAIIKIRTEDFEKVNQLLFEEVDKLTEEDLKAHILDNYETKDLQAVVAGQEEWNIEEVYIAQKILELRGAKREDVSLAELQKRSIKNVKAGKEASWLSVLAYALFVTIGHYLNIVLPVAGLGMGYYLAYGKKADLTGKKHFLYKPASRDKGKIILYGGLVYIALLVWYLSGKEYWDIGWYSFEFF
ncbi:MAG: hypothetical protein AAF433_08420 [Bacteroidota bacterium]